MESVTGAGEEGGGKRGERSVLVGGCIPLLTA